MPVKMPSSIVVAGRRIRMRAESSGLNCSIMGLHETWPNLITLNADMADDQVKSTAVHEVVHDIDTASGSGMSEQSVTAFSSILFAVLRDNPKLVAWLMDRV